MSNLIQAELLKLRQNNIFKVLTGFAIFGAFSYIILLYLTSRNLIDVGMVPPGQDFNKTGIKAFSETTFNDPQLLLFVLSIFAGFFISNDYRSGAIKNAIISGNSRIRIYVAKLFIYIVGIYIFMTLFTLISTIGTTVLFGIGEITEGNVFLYMARTYLLYLLQLGSFAAIIAMLAFFVEESGKAITLCIVLFLVIMATVDIISKYIFSLEAFFPYTFFYQLLMVFNETMSASDIGKSLLAGVSGFVFSLLIGLHFFTRKELK